MPGVGGVEQNIHHRTGRHQYGVFPRQVRGGHAVHRQNEKPLTVQVNGVLHAMKRPALVDEPDLDGMAAREVPIHVAVLLSGFRIREDPPHLPSG